MPSPSPHRIGPYRIEGEIGRGGMGIVWLATDTRLDREVAIKALSPALSLSTEDRERLEREAKLLASLNHPHIATIYDIASEGGALYLVLELLEGEGLEERLEQGPLTLDEALRVGAQVAEALEAAHDLGIVHRDLKPGNVRFTGRGAVKLLDFGISEIGPGSGLTTPGGTEVLGTPGYMSPEQVRGGWVDLRTDVWSLGCVLYECMTGGPAFGGETAEEILAAIRSNDPDWGALPEDLPEALEDLLRRCLSKEPRERPHEAREVGAALRRVAEESGKKEAARQGPRHNLPARRTSFIGREREIRQLGEALAEHRLVTLTGVGGSGKTRLALEAVEGLVEEYPDGVWLAELAARTDPALVPQAVADVFGLKELPGRSIDQVLLDYLQEKELLLVLDNCEHLLQACAALADTVLGRCPGVKVLASSREGLAIDGEVILQVPSLEIPPEEGGLEPERLGEYEAVRLFLERARVLEPDFDCDDHNAAHVSEICRRLDGMPLAIELAAARVPVLAASDIAARLNDAFRLLTGGSRTALPRQRTLQATIDWSYQLLDEKEQTLFRRLSVFVGGWTLEAAEEVCSGDGMKPDEVLDLLGRLVRKSLVEVQQAGAKRRYRFLETVRQLAEERLAEVGESDRVRERHLEWFCELLVAQSSRLLTMEQLEAVDCLIADHENTLAAMAFAQDHPGATERLPNAGLRMAAAGHGYAQMRGDSKAHSDRIERLLDAEGETAPAMLRAEAMFSASSSRVILGEHEKAEKLARECERVFQQEGSATGAAKSKALLGKIAALQGHLDTAEAMLREALAVFEREGDERLRAQVVESLGAVASIRGDFKEAGKCLRKNLLLMERLGDGFQSARARFNLGVVAWAEGDHETSREKYLESLEVFRRLNASREINLALQNLGAIALELGNLDEAEPFLAECLTMARERADRPREAAALQNLSWLAKYRSRMSEARSLLRECLAIERQVGDLDAVLRSLALHAVLAIDSDHCEWGARLLGTVANLRRRHDVRAMPASIESRIADATSAALDVLGRESLDAAMEQGGAMSLEEAVEYALGNPDEDEA